MKCLLAYTDETGIWYYFLPTPAGEPRRMLIDITPAVESKIASSGVKDGSDFFFLCHGSTAVIDTPIDHRIRRGLKICVRPLNGCAPCILSGHDQRWGDR